MIIGILEYSFDYEGNTSGGADICTRNMAQILAKNHDVKKFIIAKELENGSMDDLVHKLNECDIVIHSFLYGTYKDEELLTCQALLKTEAITVYIEHDRYPYKTTFYDRPLKPKVMHCCDYIWALNTSELGKYIDPSRILELGNFYNYRDMSLGFNCRGLRQTDLLYQARVSPNKGVDLFYNFAEYAGKQNLFFKSLLVGFSGSPAEIGLKQKPGCILNIWKDTSKVQYNSDEAFLRVLPFEKNPDTVAKNLRQARYSWNCYYVNTKYPMNSEINPSLEGAAIEAILCGAVPILNGLQRKMVINGSTLEDLGCCLFLDGEDYEKLYKDMLEYDSKWNENRVVLEQVALMLADIDNYVDFYNECLQYVLNGGKQKTLLIDENKFSELRNKKKTYLLN